MAHRFGFVIGLFVSVSLLSIVLFTSVLPIQSRTVSAETVDSEPPPPVSELGSETPPETSPAQPTSLPVQRTIYLQSRAFVPGETDIGAFEQLADAEPNRVHILLQLDFIPRQAAKAEFEARGVKLLAYVPDYAWIASVPATNPAAVLHMPGVTWAGELTLADKLAPAIVDNLWGSYNLAPDGTAVRRQDYG